MTPKITRHYLTINGRQVHYRRAGKGPPLLMVHQSPRSSAEYEALMLEWGRHFTCIAPDLPGFGLSDPLNIAKLSVEDIVDSLMAFTDALGIRRMLAYGFHTGAIVLMNAVRRAPQKFTALSAVGYPIWNEEEREILGDAYIPPNPAQPFGEHLVWMWNRILEQSWYFPWYRHDPKTRMPFAHDNPELIALIVDDMLNCNDAYRHGYRAAIEAQNDIPSPDTEMPPALLSGYQGDPLTAHLDRTGALPKGWHKSTQATPVAQRAACLDFLLSHREGDDVGGLCDDEHQGFLEAETPQFCGLIHWHAAGNPERLHIHAPGKELGMAKLADAIEIDMPGHGLSDRWKDKAPDDWLAWQDIIDAVAAHFGTKQTSFEPHAKGDIDRLYPDLRPSRFGHHLTEAWAIVRAAHVFEPWYEANAGHAIDFDSDELSPERLVVKHRALIRAVSAKEFALALHSK